MMMGHKLCACTPPIYFTTGMWRSILEVSKNKKTYITTSQVIIIIMSCGNVTKQKNSTTIIHSCRD